VGIAFARFSKVIPTFAGAARHIATNVKSKVKLNMALVSMFKTKIMER